MKQVLSILTLATVLLFVMSVMAEDKVVVVPMGSNAKGTDGQVQYNDEGKTAGAEVYYDKATGKLEVPGEVRTVDGSGATRLWGSGMPNSRLLTHTDPNGYCTTDAGVKFALSYHMVSWESAEKACPTGTWVCKVNDLSSESSCPIVPVSTYTYFDCDGTKHPLNPSQQTELPGAVADLSPNHPEYAYYIPTYNFNNALDVRLCAAVHVWCCWE